MDSRRPPPPPPAVVVPPAPPSNVANAAAAGAVAASNAAAAASSWDHGTNDAPLPPAQAAAGPNRAASADPANQREAIELLWFDKASVERIRDNPPWKQVLDALKPKPPEDVPFTPSSPEPTPEQKEKRDVAAIMTRAVPTPTASPGSTRRSPTR